MQSALPSPTDLGAPPKFARWRPGQSEAVEMLLGADKRFVGLSLPTGSGKTPAYMIPAVFQGHRTLVLTVSRGLSDQLLADWDVLTDIRGMANYPCPRLGGTATADKGPCLSGGKCSLMHGGCPYFDQARKARGATFVSTNYAYHVQTILRGTEGLGGFHTVILDEVSDLEDLLGGLLRVKFDTLHDSMTGQPPEEPWEEWATREAKKAAFFAERSEGGERRRYRDLERRLLRVGSDWVISGDRVSGWEFEPPDVSKWVPALWGQAKRIVLVSATLTRETVRRLGIPADELEWIEGESPIPVHKRPVYHLERSPRVALSFRSTPRDLEAWVDRIDDVLRRERDSKGLIHTVSYDRMKFLMAHSSFAGRMVAHRKHDDVVAFRQAARGSVLVSPTVHTGYDFPEEEISFQIIGKVPFPDSRSPVAAARMKADKRYSNHVAAQRIVQAAGRINRTPEKAGRTYIVDNQVGWLKGRNPDLFPAYFLKAWRTVSAIP